jgi:hypothetical protein
VWLHYRLDSHTIKRGIVISILVLHVPLGDISLSICIWIELITPQKMIMKMPTHLYMTMITWCISTFAMAMVFEQ